MEALINPLHALAFARSPERHKKRIEVLRSRDRHLCLRRLLLIARQPPHLASRNPPRPPPPPPPAARPPPHGSTPAPNGPPPDFFPKRSTSPRLCTIPPLPITIT